MIRHNVLIGSCVLFVPVLVKTAVFIPLRQMSCERFVSARKTFIPAHLLYECMKKPLALITSIILVVAFTLAAINVIPWLIFWIAAIIAAIIAWLVLPRMKG